MGQRLFRTVSCFTCPEFILASRVLRVPEHELLKFGKTFFEPAFEDQRESQLTPGNLVVRTQFQVLFQGAGGILVIPELLSGMSQKEKHIGTIRGQSRRSRQDITCHEKMLGRNQQATIGGESIYILRL